MKYLLYIADKLIVPFQLQFSLCDFTKHLDKVFIQMIINVLEKNILLINYFHLKDNKNYVGDLCIKIHFICFSEC
jgi:hypothetical protein